TQSPPPTATTFATDRCLAPAQRVPGTASEKPCQAPPAAEPDTSGSGTARGRAGHPIAREEVVAAAPQRQERRRDAHPGEQLDALDEREPAPRFEAAGEHGRDGQEELVDETAGQQCPEGRRAGLGEDVLVTTRTQQLEIGRAHV